MAIFSIFRQRIIAHYLMVDTARFFMLIFLILALIVFGNQFVVVGKESVRYGLPLADLWALVGFKMVRDLPVILSLSLFLATILSISRLYKNSEAVVMNAVGVGEKHFFLFLQPLVLVMFLFVGFLTLYLVPEMLKNRAVIIERAESTLESVFFKHREFQEFDDQNAIFYASKAEDENASFALENIFIYQNEDGKTAITVAEKGGRFTDPLSGDIFLRLQAGSRYDNFFAEPERVVEFSQYDLMVADNVKNPPDDATAAENLPSAALWFDNNPLARAELGWRFAQPLGLLVLVFLAVLLGGAFPKAPGSVRLLIGIIIFFIYYDALSVAKSNMGKEAWLFSIWHVQLVFLVAALLFYFYRSGKMHVWFDKIIRRSLR